MTEPTNLEDCRSTASHSSPGEQAAPEIRRYRRWQHRRREANQTRAGKPRMDREVEDILEFVRTWAPYGGAPEEEIFVRFGMSPSRFKEKLCEILDHIERKIGEQP
ncbi:DUF3263 domain-containing protein [Rhodococcus opacus]|uniref:DUF3263 domain-containing protein n=1 Tax=Rhodococcus opacus TaxID=37919 RepID=UPI0029538B5A|nr:DUF3263 domain-containing protein [Rhodococcus opacus]MDV7090367.1 DUF3263 domain-containing protein [Rhodococcus opacus]